MIKSVKYAFAALLATTLASLASAQITPAFASGINSFGLDSTNSANYQAALGAFYFDSNLNVPSEIETNSNGWSASPLNLTTALGSNPWLAGGGSVKTIFLGETAGWKNDFGYTPSSSPSSHVALISDIENNFVSADGNINSGWSSTVNYAAGTTLDFFINSGGDLTQGGLFYAFGTANQYAGTDVSNHIKWNVKDVFTHYWDGTAYVDGNVKTLLIGFEDTRNNQSFYDGDSNDLVVAFQFLPTQPVPEPSTYGLIGAAALLGLVGYRRFKRKAVAQV